MPTVNNKARYISVAVTTEGEQTRQIPGSPPNPEGRPQQLWVAGSCCELLKFNASDTGNVAPALNIQGLATTLTGPQGSDKSFTYAIDFDSSGSQYALNVAQQLDNSWLYSIPVFASGATGDIAPLRNIQGAATLLSSTFGPTELDYGGICLDGAGNIYVGGRTTILKFSAGADGNATGTVLVSDATMDEITSLHYDAIRSLIWVSSESVEVRAYNLSGSLVRQLTFGDITLNLPQQVTTGPDSSIFVTDIEVFATTGNIFIFAPDANGSVMPTRQITISGVDSESSLGIAVMRTGITFACYFDNTPDEFSHVVSFAADADGTATALTDISGDLTFLDFMLDDAVTFPQQLNVF